MAESASPALKTFSFGGCDFSRTSPAVVHLSKNRVTINETKLAAKD